MQWLIAFHVISMVCWFAGLFYLPRLFVYHAMSEDTISIERFKVMERKLYYGITTPSAILTTVFGLGVIALNTSYYLHAPWMHAKLGLVVLLWAYHIYCGRLVKTFKSDDNARTHVFYRWFNEVPVLFLITIVILVVVKPFS